MKQNKANNMIYQVYLADQRPKLRDLIGCAVSPQFKGPDPVVLGFTGFTMSQSSMSYTQHQDT